MSAKMNIIFVCGNCAQKLLTKMYKHEFIIPAGFDIA
jgi:hypothetical protein